jgi:hypothetical protein
MNFTCKILYTVSNIELPVNTLVSLGVSAEFVEDVLFRYSMTSE